jgi:ATP-dependent Clp protease adaptor protein ClpS
MTVQHQSDQGRPEQERLRRRPPLYEVLLHNDDYTTFEFVINVLIRVFGLGYAEAELLTMRVHEEGEAVAGVYVREIAEEKVGEVQQMAAQADFPLRCSARPKL